MSSPDSGVPVSHLRLFLHDLNNEMFAASGSLQLHEMQKGRPEAEKSLSSARFAADELQILLAELSDYAAWCGDGLMVQAAPVDLSEVAAVGIERAAASLRRFGKQARLAPSGSACRVTADAQLAARAVHALVRVSLWRGACGEVVPLATSQEEGLGTVTVEDRGAAIPSDIAPRLFTVEGIQESKAKGVPPGRPSALLFVRAAAEAVGGRCWVKSEASSTRFTIGFPLAK